MIGVLARPHESSAVEEFFQLFKTPWEHFDPARAYDVVLSTTDLSADVDCKLLLLFSSEPLAWDAEAGVDFRRRLNNRLVQFGANQLPVYGKLATIPSAETPLARVIDDPEILACEVSQHERKTVRLGYDLFGEVAFLLTQGQPPENARFPTLDLHIEIVRRLMIDAGVAVLEITPTPAGTQFIACLTHDIDFVSLRQHRFDRAALGFFQRATVGTVLNFIRGRCSLGKVGRNAAAALKWPLVQIGLCEDFWLPFAKYLEAEQGRPSTFYLIPFKGQCGAAPAGRDSARRAVRYDVEDVKSWIPQLQQRGCEVAVHGIDAWSDRAKGRAELERLSSRTGEAQPGLRMHWLFFSERSPKEIEAAGFGYDSTCGYNDAVGYRAGTGQVFRLPGTANLLELPLHVQDTAMFFPGRMHLSERDAWELFISVLRHARQTGGVLTLLWHDRSLAPERLWGDFYAAALKELSAAQPWFATAREAVGWFSQRRAVRFSKVCHDGNRVEVSLENVPRKSQRDMVLRLSVAGARPGEVVQMEAALGGRSQVSLEMPGQTRSSEVSAAA